MKNPIPAAALENHIAILGKAGSGKSNAAKVVAEEIMARGDQVCAIDPTGTWWGMRLQGDGKRKSKFEPIIFGGLHADIQIAAEHGAAIAEAIATSSTNAIIDTRTMSVRARTRFFTDFAEMLLRKNQGRLCLIIDEAHVFAPQGKVPDPQSGQMLHAANNLVSLGRGLGLRIIMISQRPAKLHKDSLTQVETLLAMRLIAPQDRNAVKEWVHEWAGAEKGREMMSGLPSLATGEGWLWAPTLDILKKVRFPLASTFDTGKPLDGDQPSLSPIDIKAVTARLEEVGKEVIANDPAHLKRRIAELMKEVAELQARPAGASDEQLQKAEQIGRDVGRHEGFLRGIGIGKQVLARAKEELDYLETQVMKIDYGKEVVPEQWTKEEIGRFAATEKKSSVDPARKIPPLAHVAPPPATRPENPPVLSTSAGDLTPAKRRILTALRQLEAIGKTAPEKSVVGWFAGASPKSSAFNNNLGGLRTAGLIDYPQAGTACLTEQGKALEPAHPAPSHEDVMALVRAKVTPAIFRMLEAAASVYPSEIENAELADACGASVTSSAFNNNKGRLRSLGLIEYPSPGLVRAAALLFPGV